MNLSIWVVLAVLSSSSAQLISPNQKAEIADLVFFVDITGSMQPYIFGVKDAIGNIVDQLAMSPITTTRLAFVGYRDCEDKPRFEILQFTESVLTFKFFLGNVEAKGGGDRKEDVLGGLQKVKELNWSATAGTRVLFHIADAPGHDQPCENRCQRSATSSCRLSPRNDSDAMELLRKLKDRNIVYNFGRIEGSRTDKMIGDFSRILEEDISVFDIEKGKTPCSGLECCVRPHKEPWPRRKEECLCIRFLCRHRKETEVEERILRKDCTITRFCTGPESPRLCLRRLCLLYETESFCPWLEDPEPIHPWPLVPWVKVLDRHLLDDKLVSFSVEDRLDLSVNLDIREKKIVNPEILFSH